MGWMYIRRWLSMYKFRAKSHFIIIISVVISCLCRCVSLSPTLSSLLLINAVCMHMISTGLPFRTLHLTIHGVLICICYCWKLLTSQRWSLGDYDLRREWLCFSLLMKKLAYLWVISTDEYLASVMYMCGLLALVISVLSRYLRW